MTGDVRITPLPVEDWDDDVHRALGVLLPPDRINPDDAGNVLSTLARHPKLAKAYLHFNTYLLTASTLSPRIREVALLRIVHQRDCPYLWDHHIPIARRAGLTADEIDDIRRGRMTDEQDDVVVRAVDELGERTTITDPTWVELGRYLENRQRMDLVFAVGAYALLAMAVNSFGIQPEH
jgi:4-carboxymuconolactone decarboxylase